MVRGDALRPSGELVVYFAGLLELLLAGDGVGSLVAAGIATLSAGEGTDV